MRRNKRSGFIFCFFEGIIVIKNCVSRVLNKSTGRREAAVGCLVKFCVLLLK